MRNRNDMYDPFYWGEPPKKSSPIKDTATGLGAGGVIGGIPGAIVGGVLSLLLSWTKK